MGAGSTEDARTIIRLMRDIALDEERSTTNRIAAARTYLDHWHWLYEPSLIPSDDKEIEFTPSSGNVFTDLGFDDPEAELAKADASFANPANWEAQS